MSNESDFSTTLKSLWFRLITLAIVALVFCEAVYLAPGKAQGWTFYLTPSEVAFEVMVRLIAAALAGFALGTTVTAVVGPFLWYFESSRRRMADWTTQIAVVAVVFLGCWFALSALIKWSYYTTGSFTEHFMTNCCGLAFFWHSPHRFALLVLEKKLSRVLTVS